jgi:hypothetical protein
METTMSRDWQPIETAPRHHVGRVNYIEITDGILIQDIVIWRNAEPPRRGLPFGRPEGWFTVAEGRSRISNPKWWRPVTPLPEL